MIRSFHLMPDYEQEGIYRAHSARILQFPLQHCRSRERREPLLGIIIAANVSLTFWGTILWMVLG